MARLPRKIVAACLSVTAGAMAFLSAPTGAQASVPRLGWFFSYAQASQWVDSVGALGDLQVAQPTVGEANQHSLAEMSVSSADQQQIIEVGWIVDPATNGDNAPHLFVHRWVDGNPWLNGEHCYNRCGFVPTEGIDVPAGSALQAGTTASVMIKHYTEPHAGWWIRFGTDWLGYYPDTLWGGRFTSAGLNQWFGEVSSNNATPGCTQMGNGERSNSATAATISGMVHLLPNNKTQAANVQTTATDPEQYTVTRVNGQTIRYGGTGVCR